MPRRSKRIPLESIETIRTILAGTFEFRDSLPLSRKSNFGDSKWNFYDPTIERYRNYERYRLLIDWSALKELHRLPQTIVADLKRFAFLRLTHSREVFSRSRRTKNAHPATIIGEIDILAAFLGHLLRQTAVEDSNLVNLLSDIEVEDLENALSSYRGLQQERLKQALIFLCNPNLSPLLKCGPLKWNKHDLDTLTWKLSDREPYERIDDQLFRFLSNIATVDVKHFLCALDIEPEDKTLLGNDPNIFVAAIPSFHVFFEDYCGQRRAYLARNLKGKDHKYVVWCRKRKNVDTMRKLVDRARKAAQLVIIMYSGARLGELNSFRKDCLSRNADQWLIKGTEIKRRGLWAPVLEDHWVAIPIVRDAVKVLEQTARTIGSDYLFHNSRRYKSRAVTPLRPGDYKRLLKNYLGYVDQERRWDGSNLHLYRFRHTLVYQLRKAGLGLPFITFQLKHFYDALNRGLNNVTLIYGHLGSHAAQVAVEDANKIFVQQVYHPDAPVAGGGAEQHKARRAAYFKGMALQGINEEQTITQLANQGMPLTDVGIAICGGQRKIVKDGIRQDPPCIGGLRCNPVRCPNGLIPAYKLPAWERLAAENRRRSEDPELAYARAYHEEAAAEAEAVVQYFQIQGREKL